MPLYLTSSCRILLYIEFVKTDSLVLPPEVLIQLVGVRTENFHFSKVSDDVDAVGQCITL